MAIKTYADLTLQQRGQVDEYLLSRISTNTQHEMGNLNNMRLPGSHSLDGTFKPGPKASSVKEWIDTWRDYYSAHVGEGQILLGRDFRDHYPEAFRAIAEPKISELHTALMDRIVTAAHAQRDHFRAPSGTTLAPDQYARKWVRDQLEPLRTPAALPDLERDLGVLRAQRAADAVPALPTTEGPVDDKTIRQILDDLRARETGQDGGALPRR